MQDLPQGALEPWTDIQVTNVFNGNGKNSSSNGSSGRRLLSGDTVPLMSRLRHLLQTPAANATASYNQDLTQKGENSHETLHWPPASMPLAQAACRAGA